MVLAYTQVIAGASTNVITPSAGEINQGNDPLTPYNSAKNNGYYRQISQGVADVNAEIINVLIATGLTPDASNDQLIEAINLLVPDAATLPEAIAGANNTKFLTPYLASNLPVLSVEKQIPSTLLSNVWTKMTGFSTSVQIGDYWSGNKYTPPSGQYQFNLSAQGTAAGTGVFDIWVYLYKNGVVSGYGSVMGQVNPRYTTAATSGIFDTNGTDEWEVYVKMSGVDTLNLDKVFFSIQKIR